MNRTAIQDDRTTQPPTRPKRLRVVGCGNPYAGDDGAGLEIVRRLREQLDGSCELLDRPQAGLELLDCMQGADVVLFVDAVSSGTPPGTLHLVPLPSPDLEARGLGSLSSHGWGLTEALSLMSALGWQAPRLFLLGVEIGTLAPDKPPSEAVEAAMQTVVDSFARLSALLVEDLVAPTFRSAFLMEDPVAPRPAGAEAKAHLKVGATGGGMPDVAPTFRSAESKAHLKVGATRSAQAPRRFPPGDQSFPGGR